ncbi:MAG: exodeoxyribonuclease III [Victivallales bacterium]|nr:exodeoxyribonuclease III [Victivallales bacterium]
MRLISWNVNGIRAVAGKGFGEFVSVVSPDVLCVQETKAQDDQVMDALFDIGDYKVFANSADRKGYSGTAMLCREEPAEVSFGMGAGFCDREGRVITADFGSFFLVTVYTPNSGSDLLRLGYRCEWDRHFLVYLKALEGRKAVVVCGDLNVAHREIDLAHPKANYNKSAGYMQEEIDGMDNLVGAGFVDTFRLKHPGEVKYSWWSYRANARPKNIGWRIDYFLVSSRLAVNVESADILNEVTGSDHCPVQLDIRR